MGYDTFHLVHTLWLGVVDLPNNSSEKDWDLQVGGIQLMQDMQGAGGLCTPWSGA